MKTSKRIISVLLAALTLIMPLYACDFYEAPEVWEGYDISFVDENGIGYVWEQLSDDDRKNLAAVMNAIANFEPHCDFPVPMNSDELNRFVKFMFAYCVIEYPYVERTKSLKTDWDGWTGLGFNLNYTVSTKSEAEKLTDGLNKAVSKAIKSAPDGSDWDKIRYFHDMLILNCEYSTDAEHYNDAYGALVLGEANCNGYADAMQLLLSGSGIETVSVADDEHKWNLVKLNGEWYNLDVTWDDPNPGTDIVAYDYFMVSDDFLENFRGSVNIMTYGYLNLPQADSESLNYFKVKRLVCDSADEALKAVQKQLAEDDSRGYVYPLLTSEEIYPDVKAELYAFEDKNTDVDVYPETMADGRVSVIAAIR